MSSDAIRQAIKAKMETVPDVGRVHAYERYASNVGQLVALYKEGDRLLGWHIRRVEQSESAQGAEVRDSVSRWRITGYMALDDADESELLFDRLLDALIAAFRADLSLGGAVATTWVGESAALQLLDSGPVLFGGALCHKAVLGLAVQQFCSINEE